MINVVFSETEDDIFLSASNPFSLFLLINISTVCVSSAFACCSIFHPSSCTRSILTSLCKSFITSLIRSVHFITEQLICPLEGCWICFSLIDLHHASICSNLLLDIYNLEFVMTGYMQQQHSVDFVRPVFFFMITTLLNFSLWTSWKQFAFFICTWKKGCLQLSTALHAGSCHLSAIDF